MFFVSVVGCVWCGVVCGVCKQCSYRRHPKLSLSPPVPVDQLNQYSDGRDGGGINTYPWASPLETLAIPPLRFQQCVSCLGGYLMDTG